jgi:hypothetical protein
LACPLSLRRLASATMSPINPHWCRNPGQPRRFRRSAIDSTLGALARETPASRLYPQQFRPSPGFVVVCLSACRLLVFICPSSTKKLTPADLDDLADAIATRRQAGPAGGCVHGEDRGLSGPYRTSRVHRHVSTIGSYKPPRPFSGHPSFIGGYRHDVHTQSASVGGRDLLAAIRDARNRRAAAPSRVSIMCGDRSAGADRGLRPRSRSCDRSFAPGATPPVPETARGRNPLALTSTSRRS